MSPDSPPESDGPSTENDGDRLDRLPPTAAKRVVEGRATREEVLGFFDRRYGIAPATFDGYTFWEKGAGSVWVFRGDLPTPVTVEALGMRLLHTRQEHWKPTTNAVQRFGGQATRNVVELNRGAAAAFVRGDDQPLDWDGDWGYLIVACEVAGGSEPLGVGLFTHGTLRSQVPKGRRVDLLG